MLNLGSEQFLKKGEHTMICSDYDQLQKMLENFHGHEHIALFYNTKKFRNKIFDIFFKLAKQTNTPSLCYCKSNSSVIADEILQYDELLDDKNELNMKLVINKAIDTRSKNKSDFPTRLGGEDSTWYIDNGYFSEHQKFESLLGTTLENDFSVICGYDLKNITKSQLTSVIKFYGFAIFEEDNSMFVLNRLLSHKSKFQNSDLIEYQMPRSDEEKFLMLGKLSAQISHDLKNPLSVLQIQLIDLKQKKNLDENQIRRIDNSIKKITLQINQVLDYVKESSVQYSRFNLTELVSQIIDNMISYPSVKLNISDNVIFMLGDENKIDVMMTNLIFNSIQAIEYSGTVDIILSETSTETIIQVKDSGLGIPIELIDTIFEPLVTSKQTGTGLGLVSVKRIVTQHNGSISVKNNPTIFTVKLPKKPIRS